MIGYTVNIWQIMLLIFAGLVSGAIFEIFSAIKKLTKYNFLAANACDFFACLLSLLIFYLVIFSFFEGAFVLFEVICFAVGFVFERIFTVNLFAKPIKMIYTKFNRKRNKEKV